MDPQVLSRLRGEQIQYTDMSNKRARELVSLLAGEKHPFARLNYVGRTDNGIEAVEFTVQVERAQRTSVDIRRSELVLAVFREPSAPGVFSLREDFPDTPHQYDVAEGWPHALCIDDRPWVEARLQWTAFAFVERIRWWFAAAAEGRLHADGQPFEPIFFHQKLSVVVPSDTSDAVDTDQETLEVVYSDPPNNPEIVVLDWVGRQRREKVDDSPSLIPIVVRAQPQSMQRLRALPQTLAELQDMLVPMGVDVIQTLRSRLTMMVGTKASQRLLRPLLILVIPAADADDSSVAEVKAFSTPHSQTFADIGIGLGLFMSTCGTGVSSAGNVDFRIVPDLSAKGEAIEIIALNVHFGVSRELLARVSGRPPDDRNVVIVGGGSLGSHIVDILRRDGFGRWTIVDNDRLLPHNVQRHILGTEFIGTPKVESLTNYLNWAMGVDSEFVGIDSDILENDSRVAQALSDASVVIDATASIAASRYMSDLKVRARHISLFFTPSGDDAVLLAEDEARSVRLDMLEAQYYRALLEIEDLSEHLRTPVGMYRYSGSCRAASLKMPLDKVTTLSGLLAGEVREALDQSIPKIAIWRRHSGGFTRHQVSAVEVDVHQLLGWSVSVDRAVVHSLSTHREAALPNETGGILVGTVDTARMKICVVAALPAPEDSVGNRVSFERGTRGLLQALEAISTRTMGQVRYVGEWHSHPKGASPSTSKTDVEQLIWLASEVHIEDMPALMLIVSDDNKYTVNSLEVVNNERANQKLKR